jgi:hypothetical protein
VAGCGLFLGFLQFHGSCRLYAYRCYDKDTEKGVWAIGAVVVSVVVLATSFGIFRHHKAQVANNVRPTSPAATAINPSSPKAPPLQQMAQQSLPPGSFDWQHFPDTGGTDYTSLQPADFDPNDHSGENTVLQKLPIDSPARPEKNEDGSDPQIETDDKGQQWAVYTTHTQGNRKVSIQNIRLNPTTINGKPYVFGSISVANLTPYTLVSLQLVYESGDLKTTILTSDQASSETNWPIKPHTGVSLQIKSYAPNQPKAVPNLHLEAQIQGPPGLLTDDAELQEAFVNALGQVISR